MKLRVYNIGNFGTTKNLLTCYPHPGSARGLAPPPLTPESSNEYLKLYIMQLENSLTPRRCCHPTPYSRNLSPLHSPLQYLKKT